MTWSQFLVKLCLSRLSEFLNSCKEVSKEFLEKLGISMFCSSEEGVYWSMLSIGDSSKLTSSLKFLFIYND